jgi:hypothetical protein
VRCDGMLVGLAVSLVRCEGMLVGLGVSGQEAFESTTFYNSPETGECRAPPQLRQVAILLLVQYV